MQAPDPSIERTRPGKPGAATHLKRRVHEVQRTVAFAILAFPLLAFSQPCRVTEKLITGSWERKGETGYFEQMAFTSESGVHTFNSWLHERPDILDAKWSLANCKLEISSPESASPVFAYTLRTKGKNLLELKAKGEGTATYRRLKSAPSQESPDN